MAAEAGAETEVEVPEGGAERKMAQDPVREEGLGKPPEASGYTLRR